MLETDDARNAERLRRSCERYYRTLWRTDHSMVSAAFGLARQLAARGDRPGAIDVLDQVPLTSRHYGEAQLTSVLMLLDGRPIAEITEADLRDAARRVGHLTETEPRALQMRALVLGTALDWLRSGATPAADPILGHSFDEQGFARGYRGGASGTGAALAAAAPSLHPGRPGEFDQTAELDVSRPVAVGSQSRTGFSSVGDQRWPMPKSWQLLPDGTAYAVAHDNGQPLPPTAPQTRSSAARSNWPSPMSAAITTSTTKSTTSRPRQEVLAYIARLSRFSSNS